MIYASADAGHRKGVRGLTEEATLGAGIRLAFGAPPSRRPFDNWGPAAGGGRAV